MPAERKKNSQNKMYVPVSIASSQRPAGERDKAELMEEMLKTYHQVTNVDTLDILIVKHTRPR